MAPGPRRKKYTAEDLQLAVLAVKEQGYSVRKASEEFNVPKSTIQDGLAEGHDHKIGRPMVLSEVEEDMLVELLQIMANWGFPLSQMDLCHFVKSYLDKKGVKTVMKDNKPTLGFVKSFLNRHPELGLRQTNPIKRSRASVSREDVTEFFNHFSKSVEGVAPENLINFDESAIKDDPGTSRVICKKGQKYVETVQNTSKQVMIF
jgi:transposase